MGGMDWSKARRSRETESIGSTIGAEMRTAFAKYRRHAPEASPERKREVARMLDMFGPEYVGIVTHSYEGPDHGARYPYPNQAVKGG